MIPSINALTFAMQCLLLERIDWHHAISTLEITDPTNEKIPLMRGKEHDLFQVITMLNEMIERRTSPDNSES